MLPSIAQVWSASPATPESEASDSSPSTGSSASFDIIVEQAVNRGSGREEPASTSRQSVQKESQQKATRSSEPAEKATDIKPGASGTTTDSAPSPVKSKASGDGKKRDTQETPQSNGSDSTVVTNVNAVVSALAVAQVATAAAQTASGTSTASTAISAAEQGSGTQPNVVCWPGETDAKSTLVTRATGTTAEASASGAGGTTEAGPNPTTSPAHGRHELTPAEPSASTGGTQTVAEVPKEAGADAEESAASATTTLTANGANPAEGNHKHQATVSARDDSTEAKGGQNAGPDREAAPDGVTATRSLGTPSAQQETFMKKAEKMVKAAESAQQNLPGEAVSAVKGQEIGAEQSVSTNNLSEASRVDPAATASTGDVTASDAAAPTAATGDDARLRALERTHDLVTLHALRLGSSNTDSIRVVIEPGSGTRLSLELRQGSNGVEAQAVLHRGDFQYLNQHWSELQQRLEPRGVHLATLQSSTDSSTGESSYQQPERQSGKDEPARTAFAEFAFGGSMTESPATRKARAKTHRGWESWA